RDVGVHPVLLGPYSRFDFYHPGPLGAYLLSVPYRLLGEAHESLAIGTLLIAALSLGGCAYIVRARFGTAAGLWTIVVLVVTLRLMEAGFLRDSWNPYLPVLPLLLAVLLCWTALTGRPMALPIAVLLMSLAVQSHVGYLAPVGATLGLTGLGLLVGWLRRRRGTGDPGGRRLLVALGTTVILTGLVWLPPLVQQLTGDRPNGSALLHYLRTAQSDSTVRLGVRAIADELAKLPTYAVGVQPPHQVLLPLQEPLWAAVLAAGAFALAVFVAWRQRRGDLLWLAALTVVLGLAGVAAVARVQGLPFPYVTAWTAVVGALVWIFVGATLLPVLAGFVTRARLTREVARPVLTAAGVVGTVAALVAVVGLTAATVRAPTPQTDYSGNLTALELAVRQDLAQRGLVGPDGRSAVRVDFASTTRPVIVGTSFPGYGLVLALVRDQVDVQLAPFWQGPIEQQNVKQTDPARYVVTLAYADGSSPPPAAGQRVLAVAGEYQVYGGPSQ
ncbi:MAG: hypothetical protein QOC98_716, partial [Frankiaceae bacterium]|nr:hypothetical protein [Frankiaceae bacterium]